jgi:peptide deformylase
MAIRKIASIGHPVLRERAREISGDELRSRDVQRFIDDLIETMRDARGAGLAANQVHEPIRVCAIEVSDNPRYPYKPNIPLTILVNPEIDVLTERTFENYEGCLSVPNLRGVVRRHTEVRVRGLTRHGEAFERVARGLTAGTFQHEIDHLDGVLFVDRIDDPKTLCTWPEFERFHRDAFVERITKLVAELGE